MGAPAQPAPGIRPSPGTPGTAATAGTPGTAATAGAAGTPGSPATAGTPGTAATAGTPGTAATAGAAGTPGTAATAGAAGTPGTAGTPDAAAARVDVEQLASIVYERIGERIEQRLAVPQEMPSVDQAVMLREKAPELYDLWLKIAQDKAATGNYVQRAPYEVPERLAQSGRPRALSAMVVVLAFCGYLAWLGGPGPYLAGLIAVLDLVVMLGLFYGLRPEHLADSRQNRKRPLPRPAATTGLPTGSPGWARTPSPATGSAGWRSGWSRRPVAPPGPARAARRRPPRPGGGAATPAVGR
jgi:hypothetical protein